MQIQEVVDEIKLELTGRVLELEIEDAVLMATIKKALRELERYWDETTMITIPFASCIDVSSPEWEEHVSSVVQIYRTEGVGDANANTNGISVMTDPAYAQQYMLFSNGGTMYNLNDYLMNYASWMTLCKIKNTISTDLSFKEDRHNKKLYINSYMSTPKYVTVEYIPKLKKVDDIKSDYWIDVLIRLSTALTKVQIGRIRTRFTQTNALWAQDGEKMLEEGNTELKELREVLRQNSNLCYPLD